jgi:hypothetical protein
MRAFDHRALANSAFLKYQAFAVVGYALMYYLLQLALLYNKPNGLWPALSSVLC